MWSCFLQKLKMVASINVLRNTNHMVNTSVNMLITCLEDVELFPI